MLSLDHPEPRKRHSTSVFFIVTGVLLLASGCGFSGIHSPQSPATISKLETFEINHIPDRIGQMLRNELIRQMRHGENIGLPRFYLSVSLNERLNHLGIRKDDVATRANLVLNATFKVTDQKKGRLVYSGSSRSVSSYDILTSDFATLSALQDARRRGVKTLAQKIKTRISIWLMQQQKAEGKK